MGGKEEVRIFLLLPVPGPKVWKEAGEAEMGGMRVNVYFIICVGNSLPGLH